MVVLPKESEVIIFVCFKIKGMFRVKGVLDMSPIVIKRLLLDVLVLSCRISVPCIDVVSCLIELDWLHPAIYQDVIIP